MASPSGSNAKPEKTLVSWKEIAAFFDRAERTVKRWERERALPVHRVPGGERGGVYAYPAELSEWLRGKSSELETDEPGAGDQQEGKPADLLLERNAAPPGTAGGTSASESRRKVSLVRLAAWLLPLGLPAALIFYFSFFGGHRASSVTVVGSGEPAYSGASGLDADAVAVLPFRNVKGDLNSDYLCDGITESLISNLAHIPGLKVRSRDAVFRLKGNNPEVQEAGSELGVAQVVTGRVTVQSGRIEVSAELTDVRDNTEIWGRQYAGETADLIRLQEQIANDVAKELRSTLSAADRQRVTHQDTRNPDAYNLYLKGRYAWNLRDRAKVEAAISFFNQATEKDPSYALAYSGLADAYSVLPNFGGDPNEDFPKSNAAARRALELDPTLARPHAVLGNNEMEYNWDFATGEVELRKAIALDPNDATAHQWYAEKIGELGRHEEALAEIHRAHDLDPLSPVITRVLGGTLLDAGQADRAIEVCQKLVEESPTVPIGHDCLFFAYWSTHRYAQAIEERAIESRLTRDPDDIRLANAMERGFRAAGWNGALDNAIEVLEASREKSYVSPFMIARLYADRGKKDKAFRWFDIALREHDRLLIGINASPGLEKIRSDPRYAELVRKIGLPTMQ